MSIAGTSYDDALALLLVGPRRQGRRHRPRHDLRRPGPGTVLCNDGTRGPIDDATPHPARSPKPGCSSRRGRARCSPPGSVPRVPADREVEARNQVMKPEITRTRPSAPSTAGAGMSVPGRRSLPPQPPRSRPTRAVDSPNRCVPPTSTWPPTVSPPRRALSSCCAGSPPLPSPGKITVPTMLVQGVSGTLFGRAGRANARQIAEAGGEESVIWYTGGHDGGVPGPQLRSTIGDFLDTTSPVRARIRARVSPTTCKARCAPTEHRPYAPWRRGPIRGWGADPTPREHVTLHGPDRWRNTAGRPRRGERHPRAQSRVRELVPVLGSVHHGSAGTIRDVRLRTDGSSY